MTAVVMCGRCYKVSRFGNPKEPWRELPEFLVVHGMQRSDLRLVHGYCPMCRVSSKKRQVVSRAKRKDFAA